MGFAPLLIGAAVFILAGAVVFYTAFGGDGGDETASTAEGGDVLVLAGAPHTVRHSNAALPSSSSPQADGLPTLVWFSGTWCTFCHQMEPFAYDTAGEFVSRMHFVEKSVDHDRDATGRYGVRGTPTFVLIDAKGEEIARFAFQADAESFAAAIESGLEKAGV